MRNRLRAVLYGVTLTASVGGAAEVQAQQAQASKRWSVTASATTIYDSNVGRQTFAGSGPRAEGDDVIFQPAVSAAANLQTGRQRWFGNASASYAFYQNNDILNRERLALDVGVESVFGRCAATPRVRYSRGASELFDLTAETLENVETIVGASLEVDCARQSGVSPYLSVSRSESSNSEALRRELDSHNTGVSAGLTYRRAALGSLSSFVSYSKTDYPERILLFPGEAIEDGYEVWSGGLRYSREVGSRLTTQASASMTSVNPSAPNADTYEGVTYGLDATYRPSSRLALTARAGRDVQPATRLGVNYSIVDRLGAGATFRLRSSIALSAGLALDKRTYEGSILQTPSGVPLSPREEEFRSVYAGARWNWSRRISLSADVRREDREADLAGFDYGSTRVSVGLVAAF